MSDFSANRTLVYRRFSTTIAGNADAANPCKSVERVLDAGSRDPISAVDRQITAPHPGGETLVLEFAPSPTRQLCYCKGRATQAEQMTLFNPGENWRLVAVEQLPTIFGGLVRLYL